MNNLPRQTIQSLLAKQGYDLLDKPQQIEAILQDICRDCKAEIFVLVSALKERIPHALLQHSQSNLPIQLKLDQLTKQLEENRGLAKESARWAVESWALALGLISDTQTHPSKPKQLSQKPSTEPQTVVDPQRQGVDLQYADLGKRLLAFLLDFAIMYVILIIIIAVVFSIYEGLVQTTENAEALGFMIGTVVGWLYYALQESSTKQATLGKRAFSIAVTDTSGNRISFARATGRFFGKWLSSIMLAGYVMAVFTRKNQALHDLLAGCLVVRK